MSKPGDWAKPGDASPPGYAPCPATHSALNGTGYEKAQAAVNEAGNAYGCHGCGKKKSGNPKGDDHWTCDHQPPKATYSKKNAPANNAVANSPSNAVGGNSTVVRLYPHCWECKGKQGGKVNALSTADKRRVGREGFDRNKNTV
jgi:hypothetical protein